MICAIIFASEEPSVNAGHDQLLAETYRSSQGDAWSLTDARQLMRDSATWSAEDRTVAMAIVGAWMRGRAGRADAAVTVSFGNIFWFETGCVAAEASAATRVFFYIARRYNRTWTHNSNDSQSPVKDDNVVIDGDEIG